jgi:hypothetical protein
VEEMKEIMRDYLNQWSRDNIKSIPFKFPRGQCGSNTSDEIKQKARLGKLEEIDCFQLFFREEINEMFIAGMETTRHMNSNYDNIKEQCKTANTTASKRKNSEVLYQEAQEKIKTKNAKKRTTNIMKKQWKNQVQKKWSTMKIANVMNVNKS